MTTTDATPTRGGGTQARVSASLAESLFRAAPTRGSHVRFMKPGQPDVSGDAQDDEVLNELVAAVPWTVTRSHDFAQTSHINLQEKREASNELRERTDCCLVPLRYINFADSSVHIGSTRHGRSSSYMLNGLMRRDLGWGVLGGKSDTPLYLNTKVNPSDDPSRGVPLRPAEPCPPWARDLLASVAPQHGGVLRRPHLRLVQEIFSGCGELSRHLYGLGLPVGRPMEAYPKKGVYLRLCDIMCDRTYDYLVIQIKSGRVFYIHFGTPCKTWGPAARLNKCTRTSDMPQGDGSLPREVDANSLVDRVCDLCELLCSVGGHFSIENPAGSYIFKYVFACC